MNQITLVIFAIFGLLTAEVSQADGFLQKGVTENKVLPELQQGVGIEEHLGKKLDLALTFKNEKGEEVPLSTYFHNKKPVLLTLVYYSCPGLCNFHLNGLNDIFKKMPWSIGKEYEVVTISFDPKEGPDMAAAKKRAYLEVYGRKGAEEGWHFLTGNAQNIAAVAGQVGFKYKWVESEKEYAHTSAAYVLTPDGHISRYLYGIAFPEKDLKLSLLEASNGTIGNFVEQLIMFCYQYDPNKKTYAFYAFKIMQVGAALTLLIVGLFLGVFWWKQKKLKQQGET